MKKGKDGGFSEKQAARAADGRLHEPALHCGGQLRRRAEGGRRPPAQMVRLYQRRFLLRSVELGEGGERDALQVLCALLRQGEDPALGHSVSVRRRPAQPVRRLNVRRARSPHPLLRRLRRVLHDGGESVARCDDDRRRLCRHRVRHDELTLLLGGAAVSAPA